MFTGIVAGVGEVVAIEKRVGLHSLTVKFPSHATQALAIGASVAIDGVCLTITSFKDDLVVFDAMQQTLAVTALGALEAGSRVNLERAAKFGDEIGGHSLSGHVDFQAQIVSVTTPENNHTITFQVPPAYQPYIFPKGYIGVHGASLTIADVDSQEHTFTVWLIPETLRLTTFAQMRVGQMVNIEIDRTTQIIVDTVNQYLERSGR